MRGLSPGTDAGSEGTYFGGGPPADVGGGDAEAFRVQGEGALPGRVGLGADEVGSDVGVGSEEIGLADLTEDRGEEDCRRR